MILRAVKKNAELLLAKSHSTGIRGHLRKLAGGFGVDKSTLLIQGASVMGGLAGVWYQQIDTFG